MRCAVASSALLPAIGRTPKASPSRSRARTTSHSFTSGVRDRIAQIRGAPALLCRPVPPRFSPRSPVPNMRVLSTRAARFCCDTCRASFRRFLREPSALPDVRKTGVFGPRDAVGSGATLPLVARLRAPLVACPDLNGLFFCWSVGLWLKDMVQEKIARVEDTFFFSG